jgi:hypothetical protein
MRRIRSAWLIAAIGATLLVVPRVDAQVGPVLDDDDRTAALGLETKLLDNLWDGQLYEIEYRTPTRVPGDVAEVGAFADSALWTGTYLAAQSFRYALAKRYLAGSLDAEQLAFWQQQRDEALARVRTMVAKFHILTNISKSWNHELQPSAEQAGFGGGVFNGEPGYLMRACQRTNVPEWQRWRDADEADPTGMPAPYTANRRVFGPLNWRTLTGQVVQYYCEDGTSRDAYAGTTFGLLTAFDLVSRDDPAMRRQIRNDIVTLVNFAFKYLWNTPRPHGRISIPFGTNQNDSPCSEINAILHICGHDFENFASPLFVITPFARLNMAQAASHVVTAAPGRTDSAKWKAVFTEELVTMAPFVSFAQEFDQTQPYNDYYKHNLDHLIGFNLIRNAPNAVAREVYAQAMGIMDSTTRRHLNAHFETITYALTGEADRLVDAVTHLREWRTYRSRIESGGDTDHRELCEGTIECVPEDQVDVSLAPGADPVPIPGVSSDLRARHPLPIADRTPTDFLWQRAPNQLVDSVSPTHQAPGVDYLLPYWMLRYYTEGATPIGGPFPAWHGPTYS